MSHMGHSIDDFVIPDIKKPKLKCKTCKHLKKEKGGDRLWCTQPPHKMWHTTEKDRFCYFHSELKWR